MVEAGCGRKHPFGKQLIETARQMPDFEITAKIVKEAIRTDGVGVTCHFTISLKNVNSVKVTTKRGARKLTASILLMTSDNVGCSSLSRPAVSDLSSYSNGWSTNGRRSSLCRKDKKKAD